MKEERTLLTRTGWQPQGKEGEEMEGGGLCSTIGNSRSTRPIRHGLAGGFHVSTRLDLYLV